MPIAEIVRRVNLHEELITALDWLIDAVPSQDNDHDWWPDELTIAMKNAKLIQAKAETKIQG